MRSKSLCMFLWVVCLLPLLCAPLWAAFGEDIEKPKPEFSHDGQDRIARLVPRGKSNAIQIRFHLQGGRMMEAAAMDFAPGEWPPVDGKNFRSDFFKIEAAVPAGEEVSLSVSSDYFTSATELWAAQAAEDHKWGPLDAKSVAIGNRVTCLIVTVKDGGALDADGQADGRITVIFGPRDSFWGYALGTLFIRFFGIFLVLTILMFGMTLSGRLFQYLDRRKAQRSAMGAAAIDPVESHQDSGQVPAVVAAAVAVALHLHLAPAGPKRQQNKTHTHDSVWSQAGRAKLMSGRLPIFDRPKRP